MNRFTINIIFKYFFALLLVLLSMHCINSKLDNPCDVQSESFVSTFILKSIFKDTTSHCGYSLHASDNSNNEIQTKILFQGNQSLHTLLIWEDGKLKAWGYGANGQLGYGNNKNVADGQIGNLSIKESPFLDLGGTAIKITGGSGHSCVLLTTGAVRCWGEGSNGKLGYSTISNIGDGIGQNIIAAGDIPLGGTASQISAGANHTCTLLTTGAIRCWGSGANGQLGYSSISNIGDGIGQNIIAAGDIPLGGSATQISIGANHTCTMLTTGAIRCWGNGASGQLGHDSIANIANGVGQAIIAAGDIPLGGTASQISAGTNHTCALLTTGKVRCWGSGANGQLGYNSISNIGDGVGQAIIAAGDIPLGGTASQISAGTNHTCALLTTGKVRCWGSGANGQLGYNSISNIGDGVGQTIIAAGDIPLGGAASQISAGANHTCALLSTGKVRCWGNGANGSLGYNSTSNIASGTGLTILQAGDIDIE